MHPLDHIRAKLGLEVQAEQAQVEATTNLASVHLTNVFSFYF
jgi:hypothetical protein